MILNLTQHKATPDQKAQGVVDLPEHKRPLLIELLTFESIPSKKEIEDRAHDISMCAIFNDLGEFDSPHPQKAMIGGAPFLMSALESALLDQSIEPVYAFSKRESVEKEVDGKVIKTNVFKHIGFVSA